MGACGGNPPDGRGMHPRSRQAHARPLARHVPFDLEARTSGETRVVISLSGQQCRSSSSLLKPAPCAAAPIDREQPPLAAASLHQPGRLQQAPEQLRGWLRQTGSISPLGVLLPRRNCHGSRRHVFAPHPSLSAPRRAEGGTASPGSSTAPGRPCTPHTCGRRRACSPPPPAARKEGDGGERLSRCTPGC